MKELILEKLQKKLSERSGLKLDLILNENSSIMLNLLEKKRDRARLSIHKIFLNAPEEVIAAVAHYVRGTKKPPQNSNLIIKGYIQQNLSMLDYSHRLNPSFLVQKGKYYDLQAIYDRINKKYFQSKVHCQITWYGAWKKKNRCRVTFGQYLDTYKLIKIHRLLDDPFFPEFFVSFVVYHEMLHSVVKGHIDPKGRFRIHSEAFKVKEKQFEEYEKAIAWERLNRNYFFR